jgi:hypothetical protein
MIYKKLGEDLLELPAIGQGIGLYDWNDSHIRVMEAGIDLGMSFFDTAEGYDDGNSEIIIGKAIRGRRDKVIVGTKFSPKNSGYNNIISAAETDSFAGLPSVSEKDGASDLMKTGNVSVTDNYIEYLDQVMAFQEGNNPLSHIKKYDLVAGDACLKAEEYFEAHPETIVALAYFDFDIYEPTKKCLELIRPRLVRGSVLEFDELNDPDSPGET